MKTTPRPDQSDDLQLDSSVLVSSTWEPGTLSLDAPSNKERSVPRELSDTDRWASTPSKWGVGTGRGQSSDWEKDACLEFRVRCEGQPTRRLRLSGARYTLGSGVGCSIRLDDPSLRPLHAVLIRDQARVLVRAYSVPFQINDSRVTEGILNLHDRLRLGEYEFELLEHTPLPEQAAKPRKQSSAIAAPPELSAPQNRSVEMDEWERSFHEEAKHWRALKQDVERRDEWCRSREQEVLEQREWLDSQTELLQKRKDELTSQESAAIEVQEEFSDQYVELKQRQREIELQQEELDAGREHLRLQQDRLDGRDRLHRLQIEKLLSEQDGFRDQNVEQERIIADAENQVRSSQERADAANAAVEQMRLKFASLNEQLLELTEQQESLQRLEADRNREHQLRCDDLAMSRDEALVQRDDAALQRDEAIDAKAHSDVRREKTLLRCDELETIEGQLRVEIKQLQDEIATTRNEASQLDEQCKSARETIAQLEDTIQTNEQRHESDRESWTLEVESLRKNLDDLTLELAGAQSQLTRLREDNDRLAEQLTGAHRDRDDARQKQEAATRECEAANLACEEAKAEIVTARRQLAEALTQCDDARQDREELQAQRDQLDGELNSTKVEREDWERRAEQAESRYTEAQRSLADARDQWQKAEHARDDAETHRLAAEQKLVEARRDLETMQIERDNAVSDSADLRRQRDVAVEDANQTRQLYDRSNRDHDDTLDRIEHLERQTREVITDKKKSPPSALVLADLEPVATNNESVSTLGLVGVDGINDQAAETPALPESVTPIQEEGPAEDPNDDVWPTYSVVSSETSEGTRESMNAPDVVQGAEIPQDAIDQTLHAAEAEPAPVAWNTAPVDMPPIPTDPQAAEPGVEDASESDRVSGVYEIAGDASVESLALPEWPASQESAQDNGADLSGSEGSFESVEPVIAESSDPTLPEVQPLSEVPASPEIPEWPEETASHLLPKEQIGSEEALNVPEATVPVQSIEPALLDEPHYSEQPLPEPQADPGFSYNEFNYDEPTNETPASLTGLQELALADPPVAQIDPMQGSGFDAPLEADAEAEESIGDRLLREMGLERKEVDYPIDRQVDAEIEASSSDSEELEIVSNSWSEDNPPEPDFPPQSELRPQSELSEEVGQTAMVSEPMLAQLQQLEASYNDSSDEDSVNMTAQWQPEEMLEQAGDSLVSDDAAVAEDSTSNALLSGLHAPETENLFSEPEQVAATEEPYMGLESQTNQEDSLGSDPTATEPADSTTPADSASGNAPSDDDSIEAYMNRLLQRVQGQAEADDAVPPAQPVSEKSASTPKPQEPQKELPLPESIASPGAAASKLADEEPAKPAEVSDDAPLVPRSQAPERNSNLSAMRELANESARSAINRSQKSHSHTTRIQAMLKFVYAAVALLCGLVAVAMIDLVLLRFIAVVAALLVAGIFVKEGFTLMTGLMGQGGSKEPSPKVDEEEIEAAA